MLQFHILMLKYMCFTLFSTFNLVSLATGTTGRNSHKTHPVLKWGNFPCIWGVPWSSRQLLRLVVVVTNCFS